MYALKDIKTLLIDAGVTTHVYLYTSPAESSTCIILLPSFDPLPIDHELPGYMKGKFQTIIRHGEDEAGMLLAKDIADKLTLLTTEATTINIKRCHPLHEARRYRRSDSGVLEFSINYEIVFVYK